MSSDHRPAEGSLSPSVGRRTLDRLLQKTGDSAESLDIAMDDRLPRTPSPEAQQLANRDDAALREHIQASGDGLVGVVGGDEHSRAQLVLRWLSEEREEGRPWLWVELGVVKGPVEVFETLFGLLHIPVPFGLSELIRQLREEGATDHLTSAEALEEYELARLILSNALLMRRASGLAIHMHCEAAQGDPEQLLLIEQLSALAERVPMLISASSLPSELSPLQLQSQVVRSLPSLSGDAQEEREGGLIQAQDELLMTLTMISGSISSEDLCLLIPSAASPQSWSQAQVIQALEAAGHIKRLENESYLLTGPGRARAYLAQSEGADHRAQRARRFVECFARYGQQKMIRRLDQVEGGALIDRYIEAKGHLEAALDIAVAYSWAEAGQLAEGIAALAERHGPAMIAQPSISLAMRTSLSEETLLSLELKLSMLQQKGNQRLIQQLKAYQKRAIELGSDELYAQVTYHLGKVTQYLGDSPGAYRMTRALLRQSDLILSESMMIRLITSHGFACFIIRRDDEAYEALTKAIERARQSGYLRHQALALTNLGVFHSRRGNHDEARRSHQAAIEIHQHLKSYVSLSSSLCNLADAYRVEGRHEEALVLFERCLKVLVAYGNSSIQPLVWCNIGEEQIAVARYEEAEVSLKKGIQLLKEQENMSVAGLFLGALGYLYGVHYDFSRAIEAHEAFSEGDELLNGVVGFESERAKLWLKWGIARVTWGQLDDAQRAYEFALKLSKVEVDVELKVWLEELRRAASRKGLSLPEP